MKLKYYLRGLGIGILVTALILSISGDKNTMTDDQVIQRAKELGMVESNMSLADLQNSKNEDKQTEDNQGDISQAEDIQTEDIRKEDIQTEDIQTEDIQIEDTQTEDVQTEDIRTEDIQTEDIETQDSQTNDSQTEDKRENNPTDDVSTVVVITVKSGSGSDTVSRDIANAGLVENASDFDKFLCDNGYSKSIRVGTYEIEMGAGYDDIARIITGR